MTSIYEFAVPNIDGSLTRLDRFRGEVLLVVNVASHCGFTPQYAELEALYREYREAGFSVLGFPCNQFGHQEPGDEAAIKQFCSLTYDVTFPLFGKIEVNGPQTSPLYRYLKSARRGIFGTKSIKWNFTKFLIDRDGSVVGRFAPTAIKKVQRAVRKLMERSRKPTGLES